MEKAFKFLAILLLIVTIGCLGYHLANTIMEHNVPDEPIETVDEATNIALIIDSVNHPVFDNPTDIAYYQICKQCDTNTDSAFIKMDSQVLVDVATYCLKTKPKISIQDVIITYYDHKDLFDYYKDNPKPEVPNESENMNITTSPNDELSALDTTKTPKKI